MEGPSYFRKCVAAWKRKNVCRSIEEWAMIHFNEELIIGRMFMDCGVRGWPIKRRRLPRRI